MMNTHEFSKAAWHEADWWLRLFAYLLIGGVVYGILAAHVPPILGHPWSACQVGAGRLGCILLVHVWEVPAVFFNGFVAWYILKRFHQGTGQATSALITFTVVVNVAFLVFEVLFAIDGLHRLAPPWETWMLSSVAVLLASGSILGIFIKQKLVAALFPAGDGYYHPSSEAALIELVRLAYAQGKKIRCRGAVHSVAWSIYTDETGIPNKVSEQHPPDTDNLNVMLDQYTKLEWIDDTQGIVEVEAGIHLGLDPHDPTARSTLQNSLLYQAWQKGWALNDLGGITHQTVSGFQSTGSAGGSLRYNLEENLLAFRVIDGTGDVRWIDKQADEDVFHALGVSMGLLGIISKVRLRLVPIFNISGTEITSPLTGDAAPIDMFGDGTAEKPSFQKYLQDTPYTRVLWWPQDKVERMVIWQAKRVEPDSQQPLKPYDEFSANACVTQLEQIVAAFLYTLLGNTGAFTTWRKLRKSFRAFQTNVWHIWTPYIGTYIASFLSALLTFLLKIVISPLVIVFSFFKKLLIRLFPTAVNIIQPMGNLKEFYDYYWRSLPMDNAADDVMLGTEFTEIWIPIEQTKRVMNLLRDFFQQGGLTATGFYTTELYAGITSNFWLSPAYHRNTVRVDVFWYLANAGNPAVKGGFYEQYWELFRHPPDGGPDIPFRLHWGKFLPNYDYPAWADYFARQYPKWNDFMTLRAERDPKNIFLTEYWQRHLGITPAA
jgi:hypothetical protein